MAAPQLSLGYKFAVIALGQPRAKWAAGADVRIDDRYATSSFLPDGALDTWSEHIGRFHRDDLAERSFFLWAVCPSIQPEILDEENQSLQRAAHQLYLGLLIAVPSLSIGRVTSLTGANADGVARVRSLAIYPRTFHTLGAPTPTITVQRVQLAARLADAIAQHDDIKSASRFRRTLRTYREACEAGTLDERLHQFVRVAEGLVAPPIRKSGAQFAKRLKRICAGRAQRQIREMYTIRGGIEHLHGPYDRLRRLSRRDRWERLVLRCFEAEAIARYMILTYLLHPSLWPYFRRRPSIDEFWSLKPKDFRALWPSQLHFPSIAREFQHTQLERGERVES